jgi:hypothetical protein
MDFSRLISRWQDFYYTDLLMLLVEICALIIAFRFALKDTTGKFFMFYIFSDLLILMVDMYLENNVSISGKQTSNFMYLTNTIVALAELFVYYIFFSKVLVGKKIKTTMVVLFTIFLIIELVYIFTKFRFLFPSNRFVSTIIGSLEFALLIPPCFLFFWQLLNERSSIPLTKRPSFWIVTGIFFYSLISIPFYILSTYLLKHNLEFFTIASAALFYFPFTLNFVFLSIAFLCKKPLTT